MLSSPAQALWCGSVWHEATDQTSREPLEKRESKKEKTPPWRGFVKFRICVGSGDFGAQRLKIGQKLVGDVDAFFASRLDGLLGGFHLPIDKIAGGVCF